MCRSIKKLYKTEAPTTEMDTKSASLQFVRKISGFRKPSKINEGAYNKAVNDINEVTQKLLVSLVS